jgi:Domain of unknown function (DUF4157)
MSEHVRIQTKTATTSFSPPPSLAASTDDARPETAPPIAHETLDLPGQPLVAGMRAFMEDRLGHDFSRISIHPQGRNVDRSATSLPLGFPDQVSISSAELEADRAADAVLRRASDLSQVPGLPSTPSIASESSSVSGAAGGRALDPATRGFFEKGFGHNFSGVRIHDSVSAGESAYRIGAEAYTYGQDVYFASGRYQPENRAGVKLLAHELAHVVQQNPGARRSRASYAGSLTSLPAPRLQAKFVASGDAAGFTAFANSVIGVQKQVVVSPSGEVSVQSTNVQGPLTPEATELLRVLDLVINDSHLTTIEFIHGQTSARASDVNVLGGNYALSRTDLDDLSALGTQGSVGVGQGRTGGTVLAHEILEQYRKQVHGEAFPVAHAAAIAAEEVAIGATRGAERFRQVDATTLEVTIPYTYPDGRVVEVTWDIVNGNYQNVRRRVIPPPAKP